MLQGMNNSPRYSTLVGHRVPIEVANDPPFRFLAEAYEGRSWSAVRNEQKSSSCKERQQFLNLVREKVPRFDVLSLVATIDAAVLDHDRIADSSGSRLCILGKAPKIPEGIRIHCRKELCIGSRGDKIKNAYQSRDIR